MKVRAAILLSVMISIQGLAVAASAENVGMKWVCERHPECVTKLFNSLDLDRQGLEAVKLAVEKEDLPGACEALLAYYHNGKMVPWLRKDAVQPSDDTVPATEAILKDKITVLSVTAKVPRLENGRLNWAYNGPDGDREWGWCLNRHYHLYKLFNAYLETGNRDYVRCINEHIRDWVLSNPYPAKKSNTPQWRGLEAYHRIMYWAKFFYGLQQVEEFSPAAHILMLSSIPDHAHYLRHFHAGGGNWITMEMYGLATAGVCWPEFKDANMWVDYSVEQIIPEMTNQVYPDGVQKELTSSYHWVALYNFQQFADLVRRCRRKLPAEFDQGLEQMWNYLAYSLRPDGCSPLNNDSDRIDFREFVLEAGETYNRPDWTYIVTNGREGKAPEKLPSIFFPWAGQLIMRSGWDQNAHWAFFDAGPWGMGHQHNDKLHLSVAAYGRDILVDGGRYRYKWDQLRKYFLGSASHNVILIDDNGQNGGVKVTTQPLEGVFAVEPNLDYALGCFDKGFQGVEGKVIHTRAVMYIRGKFWVVVDRIVTDPPRSSQAIWHYHPDCTVTVEDGSVTSTDPDKGNLRIVPVFPAEPGLWTVELVEGQTEPNIQGWYSERYNHKQPSPTAVYSTKIDTTATFAWVLLPARGAVLHAKAEMVAKDEAGVRIRIEVPQEKPVDVTVPLKEGKPKITHPN
jgi:hypothetical protein